MLEVRFKNVGHLLIGHCIRVRHLFGSCEGQHRFAGSSFAFLALAQEGLLEGHLHPHESALSQPKLPDILQPTRREFAEDIEKGYLLDAVHNSDASQL